jgi:hypothetical protein
MIVLGCVAVFAAFIWTYVKVGQKFFGVRLA